MFQKLAPGTGDTTDRYFIVVSLDHGDVFDPSDPADY